MKLYVIRVKEIKIEKNGESSPRLTRTGASRPPTRVRPIGGPSDWTTQQGPSYKRRSRGLAPIQMDWTVGSTVHPFWTVKTLSLLIKGVR